MAGSAPSLKAGEKITVEIYPLKDGKPGGSFIEITRADGWKLFYHGEAITGDQGLAGVRDRSTARRMQQGSAPATMAAPFDLGGVWMNDNTLDERMKREGRTRQTTAECAARRPPPRRPRRR